MSKRPTTRGSFSMIRGLNSCMRRERCKARERTLWGRAQVRVQEPVWAERIATGLEVRRVRDSGRRRALVLGLRRGTLRLRLGRQLLHRLRLSSHTDFYFASGLGCGWGA